MKRVFAVVVVMACNNPSPPKEAPHDAKTDAAVAVASSTTVTPATTPAPAGCTTDADCRTWSSYCKDAPCGCRVFAKTESDPQCKAGTVTCFADPCMKKKAACQEGHCALIIGDTH
jgi:hypothetical protein